MALGQPGERREHGQEERRVAILGLKTWAEDFESTLHSIPANERSAPSDSSAYLPTTYWDVDRSPYPFRHRRRVAVDVEANIQPARGDPPDSSDSESEIHHLPNTPSPTERRAGNRQQQTRRSQRIQDQRPQQSSSRPCTDNNEQYCTQKCLIGLVTNGFLDMHCPNVQLHCADARSRAHHPVGHNSWLKLLREQLEESLDNGVTPLKESGSRGALFRVVLLAYGYAFVAKGTVGPFIKDLEHEAAVYKRLKPAQGVSIPVFLGMVDLRAMEKIYYYDHRVYIVHLTFLSWGGYNLEHIPMVSNLGKRLADGALRSLRSMHQRGVVHRDVRGVNMLYNPETNRVMIIDFERSTLGHPPRRALAQVGPNKRSWRHQDSNEKSLRDIDGGRQRAAGVDEDIVMARSAFVALNWFAPK